MLRSSRSVALALTASTVAVLAACEVAPTIPDEAVMPDLGVVSGGGPPSAAVLRSLAALRRYASPLHDLDRAMAAGFDVLVTECRDNPPVGGMGYHYANVSRIDDAEPTVLEPEILVFAPKSNGKLGLAAVEYIVPMSDAWPAPPTLFGETFRSNTNDGVWQLHVWLWRHNPAGLFEDWNPRVSCD